jgi:hypothetical protein
LLRQLKQNPAYALDVYKSLGAATLLALVRAGTENSVDSMEFLTYPAVGGVTELPLFTSKEFVLPFPGSNAVQVPVVADDLWPRLSTIVENGVCEAAIDPGQAHGIRLRREMILGIIHGS